jgi:hypothetical protein
MAFRTSHSVVGAFTDDHEAQNALADLRNAGFGDAEIGVIRRHSHHDEGQTDLDDTYAGEGAVTGVATGAGLGALWGVGILAGVMPILGPAIAGGTLAAVLSSAAAGAVAAGLAGTLIGMGIPREEAEFYESELHAGRTIITVNAPGRVAEAADIMIRHGGYSRTTAPSMVGHP